MINYIVTFMLSVWVFSACTSKTNTEKTDYLLPTNHKTPQKIFQQDSADVAIANAPPQYKNFYDSKYLAIDNFLVNGNKMMLTKAAFFAGPIKIDSSKTELWECGSPFEWLDEEWMVKTYGPKNNDNNTFGNFDGKITTIFSKGIEYHTNDHLYLLGQSWAKRNNF